MKIVIAGGSGFLGSALVRRLVRDGHAVAVLTRDSSRAVPSIPGTVPRLWWDGLNVGPWSAVIDGADAVVNLTGQDIGKQRWTRARKDQIRRSRVMSTDALVHAIRRAASRPEVFINVSAVGYYGATGNDVVTEGHRPGTGFLAGVTVAWEASARMAATLGVRVVLLRSGIVLGKGGGVLAKMTVPYRLYVGGKLGSGRQWIPWVHIDDFIEVILKVIQTPSLIGPINVVSPGIVRMDEFSAVLARVLDRPLWAHVPSIVLRLIFGEMASTVLTGQQAVPEVLNRSGFRFRYQSLATALRQIFG